MGFITKLYYYMCSVFFFCTCYYLIKIIRFLFFFLVILLIIFKDLELKKLSVELIWNLKYQVEVTPLNQLIS